MTWMMAAGATAATGGTIFSSASQVWANTPKRGGRLVCAGDQHGPADTLDPILCTASVDYWRGRMFYGKLVRLKADLSWEPELAEEVLVNADATKWTFKIRKGVEFLFFLFNTFVEGCHKNLHNCDFSCVFMTKGWTDRYITLKICSLFYDR